MGFTWQLKILGWWINDDVSTLTYFIILKSWELLVSLIMLGFRSLIEKASPDSSSNMEVFGLTCAHFTNYARYLRSPNTYIELLEPQDLVDRMKSPTFFWPYWDYGPWSPLILSFLIDLHWNSYKTQKLHSVVYCS